MSRSTPASNRVTLMIWAPLLLLVWLLWQSRQPPAVIAADAPAERYSAARAMAVLQRLLGDETPHPTGSAANRAVRDRILAELRALGVAAELRSRFVCSDFSTCATVDNILARIPRAAGGPSAAGALLLASHYDSVPASPGASDDGHAVAASIEIARLLLVAPTLHRDVLLLIGDGEEIGLLGAEAFALEPEYAEVSRVINLEARGTEGVGDLFETHAGNAEAMSALSDWLDHPAGNSTNYEVYTRLPNNTDFSVFKRDHRGGVNFAYIGGAARYHTPLDSLAQLDPRSLQHQGDNALAAIRAFDQPQAWANERQSGGVPVDGGNRVFFDLAGLRLVGWPQDWSTPMLLVLATLWLAAGWRRRAQAQGWRGFARALGLLALPAAAAGLASLQLRGLALAGATPATWTANAAWLIASTVLLSGVLAAALAARLAASVDDARWPWRSAGAFLLLAAAAQWLAPGSSYLGLLPALLMVPALWLPRHAGAVASTLGSLASLICVGPFVLSLYVALGAGALTGVAALAALTLLPCLGPLAELWRRPWFHRSLLASWLLSLVGTLLHPAFDARVPQQISLQLLETGGQRQLLVDRRSSASDDWAIAASLPPLHSTLRLPWSPAALLGAELPGSPSPTPMPMVEASRLASGQVQLQVRSPRGAERLGLVLPNRILQSQIRVDGHGFPAPLRQSPASAREWRVYSVQRDPGQSMQFVVDWPADLPVRGYVFDLSFSLPKDLAPLQLARDTQAVTVQSGDTHLVWAAWTLEDRAATR